jgi:hypothetical protein
VAVAVTPSPRHQRHQAGQAAGAHGAATARLGEPHIGVEAPRELDDEGRRPRVEADLVEHGDARLRLGAWRLGFRAGGRRGRADAELGNLHIERPRRLGPHLLEGATGPCRRSGGHRALHERSLAQRHAAVGLEELDGHLRAHESASQVHQHEHAVRGHGALDRSAHALGVRADGAVLEATGRLERELLAAHLAGQLRYTLRERGAVRYEDDPYHSSP